MSTSLIAGCAQTSVLDKADKAAEIKQANTAIETKISTPFDEEQARKAMEPGSSSIRGVLFHRIRAKTGYAGEKIASVKAAAVYAPNVTIYLYPLTEHLKEQRRLENENKKKRMRSNSVQLTNYIADKRMFNYMRHTKTDELGRYFFTDLKPGRYYLLADSYVVNSTEFKLVEVGTSVATDGLYTVEGKHYRKEYYPVQTWVDYESEVEIKTGQKELKLDSGMSIFK
jgi:hypothetical protein